MKILRRLVFILILCSVNVQAFATPTTPTTDFTDNGDGTVAHKITGLVWKRCAEGQTWTGTTCNGEATKYSDFNQVMALTSNFAGQNDWRLPNIAELNTIVERDKVKPAINTVTFPGTPSNWFWSASKGDVARTWCIDMSRGYDDVYPICQSVRLVRRGAALDSSGEYTPIKDFIDQGNGTVIHTKTNLMWQRCSLGQVWNGQTCVGKAEEFTYDQALNQISHFEGYNDWRLPTVNELWTLIEYNHAFSGKLVANNVIFVNPPEYFWSSSTYAGDENIAWDVSFYEGGGYPDPKSSLSGVLFVRGEQAPANNLAQNNNAQIDALFDWGEKNYPDLFSDHQASIEIAGYHARFYPKTNIYLGTKDGRVYVYGTQLGGLVDVGSLSSLLVSAGI